ncbi:MAG TPA: hypothetical protein VKJ01_16145 [Candidatus Solibacter sp.]|nr:hypothetical protein [Candidatus Solibacter sp.]
MPRKWARIVEIGGGISEDAQEGFVNEGGGLEGDVGEVAAHLGGGQAVEFGVDQGEEAVDGRTLYTTPAREEQGVLVR